MPVFLKQCLPARTMDTLHHNNRENVQQCMSMASQAISGLSDACKAHAGAIVPGERSWAMG